MTTKPQSTTEEKQLEPVSSSADVDRWKRDLVTAGWIAESATAWRAPDSSLWRGPFGAWKELQRRAKANGTDTNWPLCDVLTQLVEWAKHLHDDHDCDCHGWEARSFLIEAAQRYQAEIAQVSSCPASTAPVVEKEWAKLLAKAISTAEPTLMPERDNLTHYVISSEAFATLAQVHRAIAQKLWGTTATAAPVGQSGILTQAISFCNHLAEHVTQELTEQSDNPQRDILNYEDYRKGQIQAAVEIRDRLQRLVSNADEGAR